MQHMPEALEDGVNAARRNLKLDIFFLQTKILGDIKHALDITSHNFCPDSLRNEMAISTESSVGVSRSSVRICSARTSCATCEQIIKRRVLDLST